MDNSEGQLLMLARHDIEIKDLQKDMSAIKPIVYNTQNSVKNIEMHVEEMKKNSDKVKNYVLGGAISGFIGIVFLLIRNGMGL